MRAASALKSLGHFENPENKLFKVSKQGQKAVNSLDAVIINLLHGTPSFSLSLKIMNFALLFTKQEKVIEKSHLFQQMLFFQDIKSQ